MDHPLLVLIAGPYRSGTGDDPALMAEERRRFSLLLVDRERDETDGHLFARRDDDMLPPITVMLNWAAGLTPALTRPLAGRHLEPAAVALR